MCNHLIFNNYLCNHFNDDGKKSKLPMKLMQLARIIGKVKEPSKSYKAPPLIGPAIPAMA